MRETHYEQLPSLFAFLKAAKSDQGLTSIYKSSIKMKWKTSREILQIERTRHGSCGRYLIDLKPRTFSNRTLNLIRPLLFLTEI